MKTFEEYIFEASIGRFYQHVEKEHPILVVTASRSERTKKENDKLNTELRKFVKLAGFGYIRVIGKYPETVEVGGEKKVVDAIDDSVIITTDGSNSEKLLALGKKLGKKYQQDSILFFGKLDDSSCTIDLENGKYHPVLIGTRSDSSIGGMYSVHKMGKLHFNQPAEILSIIKRKHYHLDWEPEDVEVIAPNKASGANEAMVMSAFDKFLMTENELDKWN